MKYEDLGSKAQPHLYYALGQHYQSGGNVIARTSGDPRLWTEQIAACVRRVGFNSPLTPITFESIEDLSLLPLRVVAACATALGGLGLLRAVVGLFGTISYSVSERKKEFGIRVALGARPWQLTKIVLGHTVVIAGAGGILGAVLGVATAGVVRSQLYDIGAFEWSVLIPVLAAMLAISLTVAYFSTRPWMRVDAMEAVRRVGRMCFAACCFASPALCRLLLKLGDRCTGWEYSLDDHAPVTSVMSASALRIVSFS